MPIRVFIISNFLLLIPWLIKLIESNSEQFTVASVASTHSQAVDLIANTHVDVILLDVDDNPEEVAVLIETLSIISSAKILLLTRLQNIDFHDKYLMCGVKGIIDHNTTPELLLSAIDKVHKGEMWFNRAMTEKLLVNLLSNKSSSDNPETKIALLTKREHEIFTCIIHSTGEPAKVIANKLYISESTLRNHLTSIYEKLGVTNRHGLITFAYQNDLIEHIS